MDQALLFHIFGFGVSLWLGLYIINRDPRNLRLTYTGASLVSFALGLCLDALQHYATTAILGADLARASGLFFLIAPLFWAGATVHSLPEDSPRRMFFVRIWHLGLLPVVAIAYFLAVMAGMAPGGQTDTSASGPLYDTFAFFIIIPLILVAIYFWATTRDANFMQLKRILLIGTSLLTVETACLFFPSMWFPRQSAIALGGLTLVILGATLAILDARDEGEAFLPHIVRSLDYSFFTALLFGGQVALAMLWLGGISLPMLVLLFTSVGTAIAVQIFAEPVQLILDKVAFARFPRLRKVRAQLRAAAEALPRLNDTLDLESLDETEFTRLTRRALSHFGSLHRLAASPLTQLPIVRVRLAERGADSTTLDSAAELKAQLALSIDRLKPHENQTFGTSAEWRHYNALYYPYVVGLKMYKRGIEGDPGSSDYQEVLAWFRQQVPERTLHNWQTAAARLVAQDLRERCLKVREN